MVRGVEGSFGEAGKMREQHLKKVAESGAVSEAGRASGLSLEDLGETGANVGSRDTHVKETRGAGAKAPEIRRYDTGDSGSIQANIERVRAKQAAAKKEGGLNEYGLEAGEDEEEPMVLAADEAKMRRDALRKIMAGESGSAAEEQEQRKAS